MMLFARDATLQFPSKRLFGYFCNVRIRIPFMNEPWIVNGLLLNKFQFINQSKLFGDLLFSNKMEM